MNLTIKVSVGELVDKISILQIKKEKIENKEKVKSINYELNYLNIYFNELLEENSELNTLFSKLKCVNFALWEIEDKIRILENNKIFNDEFIKLARSVYKTNDQRFEIKNQINQLFNSEIIEVKSYEKY